MTHGTKTETLIFGLILMIICAAVACRPYPRYRVGGSETPMQAAQSESGYTTNQYLRLGAILQNYLGKPYSGRSQYVQGLDCSYFVADVFDKFDKMSLPRTVKEQSKTGREITRPNITYGDLVFFRTDGSRISHVGIFVGHDQFIHASTSRGVIISSLHEKYWSQKFVRIRRVMGEVKPR